MSRWHALPLVTAGLSVACASGADPEPWQGEWEGFFETPNQLVMTTVHLPVTDADEPSATILGRTLGIDGLEHSADSVAFETQLGTRRLEFVGKRVDDVLRGEVIATSGGRDDGERFPFHLRRLPNVSNPASREEAWRQDLAVVRTRFLAYDRSFSAEGRARALSILDELATRVEELSDTGLLIGLSRVAAEANNAHTRAYLFRNRSRLPRVPIRLWWFADGLFVVGATADLRDALACEVRSIGGTSAAAVRDSVSTLFAGNESWTNYKSAYLMTAPALLAELDLSTDPESVEFELVCADRTVRRSVSVTSLREARAPVENWRNLSPHHSGDADLDPDDAVNWVHPLADSETPRYLARPGAHYWFERLPGGELYIQYNRSQPEPDGIPFDEFRERVLSEVDAGTEGLIVDLRFNTGGDLNVAASMFEAIGTHAGAETVVLTGQSTFSAGIFHAAQLRASGARQVGTLPGDGADFGAEGGNMVLPNSGRTMHFSNGYHSYSGRPFPEGAKVYRSLAVGSLRPDVAVAITGEDYLAGRDPALEEARRLLSGR